MRQLFVFLILIFYGLSSSAEELDRRIAVVCSGCHGSNGASKGDFIPIIGGQTREYLKEAMEDFKNGKRQGSVMPNLAKGYTKEGVKYLAQFFSSQPWSSTKTPFDKKFLEKGEKISGECSGCHGKYGFGGEEYPRIAGQPVLYLKQALLEYKNKNRNNDEMSFVESYKDDQLEALANYYSSIRK